MGGQQTGQGGVVWAHPSLPTESPTTDKDVARLQLGLQLSEKVLSDVFSRQLAGTIKPQSE